MERTKYFSTFFRYVIMNVLGMVGLSCYILADTFFIAKGLGSDGLTALNLAIPVYSFVHGIALMFGMGGATKYSIFMGQKHRKEANEVFISFVRNDGNPGLAMAAMLTGSFANIILDYIFIFPLKGGMFGAVMATSVAPLISMGILRWHKKQGKQQFFLKKNRFSSTMIEDVVKIGTPSLITAVFNSEQNELLQKIAVAGMKLYFIAVPFIGFNIVTSVFFSAIERVLTAQSISLLRGFILMVPMAYLLAATYGMTGIWLTVPVTEGIVAGVGMLFMIMWWKREKIWK